MKDELGFFRKVYAYIQERARLTEMAKLMGLFPHSVDEEKTHGWEEDADKLADRMRSHVAAEEKQLEILRNQWAVTARLAIAVTDALLQEVNVLSVQEAMVENLDPEGKLVNELMVLISKGFSGGKKPG